MGAVIEESPKVVELKHSGEVFGTVYEITSRVLGAEGAGIASITLTGPDIVHVHKRTEETYVWESGLGKILLGDDIFDFGPGAKVIIPPGTPHALKPAYSFPQVVFLCISAPPFTPKDVYADPRGRGRNW